MPAQDYGYAPKQAWDPGGSAAAVTPQSTNELEYVTTGLYVGGAGDVRVQMRDGQEVTFSDVAAGSVLPIRVRKVLLTGTTATDIVAIW
jgi:hypothetical protein